MINIVKISIILVSLIIQLGCSQNVDSGSTQLNNPINESEASKEFKSYLKSIGKESDSLLISYFVIPTNTCSGCLRKIKSFIQSAEGSLYSKYILVGRNYKDIRLTFSDEIVDMSNTWIDDNYKWGTTKYSLDEVPYIFYAYKGNVIKITPLYANEIDERLKELSAWNVSSSLTFYKMNPQFAKLRWSKAPEFEGSTIEGDLISLKSSNEQITVINFWSQYCAPCIVEMPILNRLYEEYKDKVQFLSICQDERTILESFLQKMKNGNDKEFVLFPIIPDAQDIIKKYSANPIPLTFVIDRNGLITDISNLTIRNNESYDRNGISSDNPYYYLILKGQIDKLLALNVN